MRGKRFPVYLDVSAGRSTGTARFTWSSTLTGSAPALCRLPCRSRHFNTPMTEWIQPCGSWPSVCLAAVFNAAAVIANAQQRSEREKVYAYRAKIVPYDERRITFAATGTAEHSATVRRTCDGEMRARQGHRSSGNCSRPAGTNDRPPEQTPAVTRSRPTDGGEAIKRRPVAAANRLVQCVCV